MFTDFHAHFNSVDPGEVREFVRTCEKNQTRAVMTGGWMGDHHYASLEEIRKYCAEYSDWLLPGAKIDQWNTPPDVSQVRKIKDMGFVMAKFICPYYEYDHDMYLPVYEELEKLDMPALFHTGIHRPTKVDATYRLPMLLNMDPLRLDRVARAFPKLKIVIAHLGTSFFREHASCMAKAFPNVYSDLAGSGAWKGLSPQDVGFYMRDIMNPGNPHYLTKLVFGSDCYVKYPEIQTEAIQHYLKILSENGLDRSAVDAVMGGTVSAWLGR